MAALLPVAAQPGRADVALEVFSVETDELASNLSDRFLESTVFRRQLFITFKARLLLPPLALSSSRGLAFVL